jgi:hypothetical protein
MLVDATFRAIADAGSIPAVSTPVSIGPSEDEMTASARGKEPASQGSSSEMPVKRSRQDYFPAQHYGNRPAVEKVFPRS